MSSTGITTYPSKGWLTPGILLIAGSFLQNASANPIVLIGTGFTVAYVSAGKYTVTLSKTYHRCIAVLVTAGESTNTGLFKANVEEIDRTTTFSSFTVHMQSTVTDTATDLQQLNFLCIVADTSIVAHRTS